MECVTNHVESCNRLTRQLAHSVASRGAWFVDGHLETRLRVSSVGALHCDGSKLLRIDLRAELAWLRCGEPIVHLVCVVFVAGIKGTESSSLCCHGHFLIKLEQREAQFSQV